MSKLALKLIEKEKKERTGMLDLTNKGLTQIPKKIITATHLQTIFFTKNYISDIRDLKKL